LQFENLILQIGGGEEEEEEEEVRAMFPL